MPGAIINYSELIQDDGGFRKLENDLKRLEKFVEDQGKKLRNSLKLTDSNDSEALKLLTKEVDRLKKANDALKTTKDSVSKARKKSADLSQKERIAIAKEREALRKLNVEARAVAKIKNTQSGSIENLRAKLSLVTIAWTKLSVAELENTKRGQRLTESKKNLTAALLREEKATGDARRQVGFYERGLNKARISVRSFLGALGITAGIVGFVRLITGAGKVISDFDESVANLSKTTGLAVEDARLLAKEIIKIKTKTSVTELLELATAAGRLNLEGQEIIDFTESVDKAFVALSDTLEGSAQDIGLSLGKIAGAFGLEEQFGVGEAINKIGSSLNELGARSKANEGFIQDFTKRLTGIAVQSGLALPEVQALGALFDETGQSVEVAATTFNKLLPAIGKDTKRFAKVAGLDIVRFEKLLADKPLEALKAVAKGAKSSTKGLQGLSKTLENYGIDSARAASIVGILSDNTERLTELQAIANDAFERGTSLTDEFNIKNNTLSATFERMTKTYDRFVLSVEDGSGSISSAFTATIRKVDELFEKLIRLNQTFSENLTDDLSDKNKDFIKNLEDQIGDNIKLKEDEAEKEIAILRSRDQRGIKTRESFADAEKRILKDLDEFRETSRKNDLIRERESLQETIKISTEGTKVTIDNAEKILEANKKISDNLPTISSRDAVNFQLIQAEKLRISEQNALASSVSINKDRIRLINLLIEKEKEAVKEIVEGDDVVLDSKRKLTGLIEKQAKVVSDLITQIQRAKSEELILRLSIKLDVEEEALGELKRITSSSLEEIDKIERNLIDDQSERRIAQEIAKSEKLIKTIESNSRIEVSKKEELIAKENARLAAFVNNEEVKQGLAQIKRNSDLAKAEFEQRRSGFSTQIEFEEEKAAQFKAIKQKAIEEEIELLKQFGGEGSDVRIEQLKAQLEGLFKIEGFKQFEDDFALLIDRLGDKLVEFNEKRVALSERTLDRQNDAEERQRDRAQAGLSNTLKFEAEETAKREAELIKSQKKLERAEKIKSLYSSYQGFSSDGRTNALGRTLRDFAILEGFAASFGGGGAVDDALIDRGILRGQSHQGNRGGIPIMVEGTEGIFSAAEMANMGKENFYALKNMAGNGTITKNFFKQQRNDFVTTVPVPQNNNALISEFRDLKQIVANKPIQNIDIVKIAQSLWEIQEKIEQGNGTILNRHRIYKKRL